MTLFRTLAWRIPFRPISTATKRSSFDIVIVGGGMVGFGFAAAAAASDILRHKNILLVEGSPRKLYKVKDTYESRTVALNAASQKLLEAVGAWNFIKSIRLQPVHKMKIWESRSESFLTFERNPLAHIVENSLVTDSLRRAIEEKSQPNLQVVYNAHAGTIKIPPDERPDQLVAMELQFADHSETQKLETSLLIGADGPHSKVREAAGIQTVCWDHGQSAVVAILHMGEGHEEYTAWQRFTSTGPIALLPLSSEYSCLIWSTTNAEADRLMSISEEQFIQDLNNSLTCPSAPTPMPIEMLAGIGRTLVRSIDSLCGQNEPVSNDPPPHAPHVNGVQPGTTRSRYPLGFQHASFYHARRVALVGDAAHRILPLAGQGVNLGFGDVLSLIRHLERALSNGADIGSPHYLREYTSDRQRAVVPMAGVMELINFLYSSDAFTSKLCNVPGYAGATDNYPLLFLASQLATGVRAAGLHSVQSSVLIKNFLMEAAVTGHIGGLKSEI